jgi:D-glycero-D-manno-heptose 1,7-bisphosphate phosphatase
MKWIILDRDGVINFDSFDYIKSPEEWRAIPGSLEAIAELNRAGYHVVVATNQSGVARGLYDLEMLNQIHEKLIRELAAVGGYIDEIFFCPHHPDEACGCRKPKPGLFHLIRDKYNVNLEDTFFIGDTATDVEVALAIGSKPLLVLTGKIGEKAFADYAPAKTIPRFKNLAEAVDFILAEEKSCNVLSVK